MTDSDAEDRRPIVVVVLPNRPFFGASLVLVPALLHLRRCHPAARFVALANHGTGALFERWGLVDEVWRHDRTGGEPFATFRRTLNLRPTLVVNCRPRSTRLHLWTMLMRARERRCFAHGLGGWIDADSRPWDSNRYKALTYLGLVGAGWHDRQGDLLTDWKMVPQVAPSGALVLVPCGSSPQKKWSLEKYLELAVRWRRSHGGPVQVLAGSDDPEVVTWVATPEVQEAGITLIRGDLPVEAAALRAAAMVVGNDCGPNHLAQLMDRPRVVLFPMNGCPAEWFRPGARAEYILPHGPLQEVSTDTVWSAIQKVAG
ncbi:MAG: hypothetical protein H0W78_07435 [Planctomycetes bacterium]|nr:hypothetical protein [Planctomycetota bacterium]